MATRCSRVVAPAKESGLLHLCAVRPVPMGPAEDSSIVVRVRDILALDFFPGHIRDMLHWAGGRAACVSAACAYLKVFPQDGAVSLS